MTANKQEKANRLLEALVAHLSESLDPDRVDDWLEQELDALLAQADKVRLNEVVTAEQIGITVRKYAVQMELGGGIPELVGEMVDRLYNHGIQAERRVGELVDESTVAALVDKVLEIPLSRRGMGHKQTLVDSKSFQACRERTGSSVGLGFVQLCKRYTEVN